MYLCALSKKIVPMRAIKAVLSEAVVDILSAEFGVQTEPPALQITRKEFDGQLTLVVFPYTRSAGMPPPELAQRIGERLMEQVSAVDGFNVVKGFLNLSLRPNFWTDRLRSQLEAAPNTSVEAPRELVVEYSSPNTNKPLHLGHIRNNLLGHSVSEILKAVGHRVTKVQVINDRGIHICKSMYAWQQKGEGDTPASRGMKGDKLVGEFYVAFDKMYKKEVAELMATGRTEEAAKKEAPCLLGAQSLLRRWEESDPDVLELWREMNSWVYAGFETTYASLGVDFDKNYYESETYLLGKDEIQKGLNEGVFFAKEDGSVWIDLTDEGLDEKILLRSDGTAVYMTQDIGTAIQRYVDFGLDGMVYTVGNEQEYHFKVLFLVLVRLGHQWAERLYHLSYGMVNLPSGKMKSREGTVVDADDLIDEMKQTAQQISQELGKTDGLGAEEKQSLYSMVGLGALKYFILKVDPAKNMLFDPEESVDFNGDTGPFIQYTHARIRSLQRKAAGSELQTAKWAEADAAAIGLISLCDQYDEVLHQAAEQYNPAQVAHYVFELTKAYNSWYQNHSVLNNEEEGVSALRLALSQLVADRISEGMRLLGVDCPERM
ncbi:MAG: arginine--tRNA ligase [Flavobacteriia bacterium]|nr:arginine--tRNA ligase [Flavobacteriia bacterium]